MYCVDCGSVVSGPATGHRAMCDVIAAALVYLWTDPLFMGRFISKPRQRHASNGASRMSSISLVPYTSLRRGPELPEHFAVESHYTNSYSNYFTIYLYIVKQTKIPVHINGTQSIWTYIKRVSYFYYHLAQKMHYYPCALHSIWIIRKFEYMNFFSFLMFDVFITIYLPWFYLFI